MNPAPACRGWVKGVFRYFVRGQILGGKVGGFIAGIIILGVIARVGIWYASGQPINPCGALWGIMCLVELVFTILFMISMYMLGKRLFGETGAVISMALSALAPYCVMISSVSPCANYNAVLFLQSVIFLLTYKACYNSAKTLNVFIWVLLGFISGIALWSNFIVISCIFTILIFLSIKYQRLVFSKKFLFASVFFLIGNLPFLVANADRLNENIQWISLDTDFFNKIGDAFICKIPEVLGFGPINLLAIVLYSAAFIYAIYISRNGFKNITRLSLEGINGLEIFLSFFIIAMIVLTRLKFYNLKEGNDFIIIYPVFVFFAVKMLLDIRRKSKFVFMGIFSFFIVANMVNILSTIIEKRNVQLLENKILNRVVSFLDSNSIDFVYTDNISPDIINFASKHIVRHGAFINKPALILRSGNAVRIVNDLKNMGLGDNIEIIGDIVILYPFMSAINYKSIEISTTGWKAKSNFNSEDTYKAYDRDMSTRWTANRSQEPFMYYELDLGKEELIDRVVLVFNPDKYDYPRALRIEFSKTGQIWEHRIDISNKTMDFLYSGKNPFLKDCEIRFTPNRVRFIKITQTWVDYNYYWSIREIFVYGL